MVKISVITVSYNSGLTIADALKSVASQSYGNIEHLIVDGKSNDDTLEIIDANSHPYLIVYSEADNGIYDAMNKGLNFSSGDVIGFLNSDDYFSSETVLEQIALAFEDDSVEACFGDLVYVDQRRCRPVRYWRSKPFRNGDFSKGWCPAHPTFYIRRSALERLGLFDLSFKLAADAEFMMRYLESGRINHKYIPSVLVKMRLGGATNKSFSNIIQQNREIFIALRKNRIEYSVFSFWMHKFYTRLIQFLVVKTKHKLFNI